MIHCKKTLSIIFSEQGNMTFPVSDTFLFRSCCQWVSIWRLDIFPYKTFCLILIFMMLTAGFEPTYVTEVQVKVFHGLLAVGPMDVRVPLYLGHS